VIDDHRDEDTTRSDPAAAERGDVADTRRGAGDDRAVDDPAAAERDDPGPAPDAPTRDAAELAAVRGRADEPSQLGDPATAITGSAESALVRGVGAADAVAEARAVALDAQARVGGGSPDVLTSLQNDEVVSAFLKLSDQFLAAQGFTEHGFRHANLVGRIAHNVLHHLGADDDLTELAAISGYLHDVGNVVSRMNHGLSSAWVAYDALRRLEVDPYRIGLVLSAVGNHEEQYGSSVGPVGAAVILADKADVHRSRVRKGADTATDIHDRVNDAVTRSFLRVDSTAATITLELELDTERSTVLEYFEIFLDRMIMCRRAARTLGCEFRITVGGVPVG
jgi:metal-dependent HD superfamily phosphatase/phosphodiesterase